MGLGNQHTLRDKEHIVVASHTGPCRQQGSSSQPLSWEFGSRYSRVITLLWCIYPGTRHHTLTFCSSKGPWGDKTDHAVVCIRLHMPASLFTNTDTDFHRCIAPWQTLYGCGTYILVSAGLSTQFLLHADLSPINAWNSWSA